MKKVIKNKAEKMIVDMKIEVAADGRSTYHFKDVRTDEMMLTRSAATTLMDLIEALIKDFMSGKNPEQSK